MLLLLYNYVMFNISDLKYIGVVNKIVYNYY